MASTAVHSDSDDDMDAFMDKFKTQRYKKGFNEETWEEVTISVLYCISVSRHYLIFRVVFS